MSDLKLDIIGKVAKVIIDRPPVNALLLQTYREITEMFDALSKRTDVNCAILTGAGTRAFCAGLDLKEFVAAKPEDDEARAAVVRATFKAVRTCALPVIAAVNGPALGAGCVLAAACDFRIAADTATFGLPEINVGRCGGGAHVGRLVPQGLLRRMFFTGQPIDAREAHRVGFVEEVVAAADLAAHVDKLAATIASKAPLGLRLGKESLNAIEDMQVEEGYALEQKYSTRLFFTDDAKEAARAVVEKRPPVFKGR